MLHERAQDARPPPAAHTTAFTRGAPTPRERFSVVSARLSVDTQPLTPEARVELPALVEPLRECFVRRQWAPRRLRLLPILGRRYHTPFDPGKIRRPASRIARTASELVRRLSSSNRSWSCISSSRALSLSCRLTLRTVRHPRLTTRMEAMIPVDSC